jgi:hypothetical protein
MKLSRALLLISLATGLFAQTSTWDTSGNGMLNGQYYFRHVLYVLSSTGDGSLYDALSVYGTVTFNGTGAYSMNATLLDGRSGQLLYSTYLGGTGADWVTGIAMAPDGAVYVAGVTQSKNWPNIPLKQFGKPGARFSDAKSFHSGIDAKSSINIANSICGRDA